MNLEESAAGFEQPLTIARLPAAAFIPWVPLIFIWAIVNVWTLSFASIYTLIYVFMDKKGVTPTSLYIKGIRSAYGSKWHNWPLDLED